MENEDFDADLKNHIKQIFEDFNDSQANEGWNLLREKYPEKNKRKYFFWWLSAAILLFTFLLIWFFPSKTDYVKSVKYTKAIQSDVANTPIKIDSPLKKLFIETDSFNTILTKKSLVKTAFKFTLNQKPTQQKTSIVNLNNTEINQQKKLNNTVFTDIKLDSVNYKNSQTSALSLTKTDSVSQKNTQLIDSIKKSITKANTKKDVVKTASISTPILKTLNLAAQIGLPISKYNLQVEPFAKVPLGNISIQQLKFGAAGINLKFNLQINKK